VEKVKTRGRLHELPLVEGSLVKMVSHGPLTEGMEAGWGLPSLGEKIYVYETRGMGLYLYGINQRYWHTVRGEWELLNFDPPLSVEEML